MVFYKSGGKNPSLMDQKGQDLCRQRLGLMSFLIEHTDEGSPKTVWKGRGATREATIEYTWRAHEGSLFLMFSLMCVSV